MSDRARASERASARSHERERVEYNKRAHGGRVSVLWSARLVWWPAGRPPGTLCPCVPPPPSDCQHALILANALQKFRGTEGSEEGGDARPSHRPTDRTVEPTNQRTITAAFNSHEKYRAYEERARAARAMPARISDHFMHTSRSDF